MSIEVKEGRFYRKRNGKIVGPMETRPSACYPWMDQSGSTYTNSGRCFSDKHEYPGDLIEEVPAPGSEPDAPLVPGMWMVAGPGPSSHRHRTRDEAVAEAKRLAAKQPGMVFFVMEAVDAYRVDPTPTRLKVT